MHKIRTVINRWQNMVLRALVNCKQFIFMVEQQITILRYCGEDATIFGQSFELFHS